MVKQVPSIIRRLRLISAFKGYNPGLLDCVDFSTDPEIHVVDDDVLKVSRFAGNTENLNGAFTALNPSQKLICLLSIDNKLMRSVPDGIADCALSDDRQFAFIEFKSNAQGNTLTSIRETYEKAISQIEHTLSIFKQKIEVVGLDFIELADVVGIVVVSSTFPRMNAMEQNYVVDFALRTGVELSFDNEMMFS